MCYDAAILDDDGAPAKPTPLEVRREAVRRVFDELDAKPTTETVDGVISGSLMRLRRICAAHDVPIDDFWSHHKTYAAATQQACLENGTKSLCDDMAALDDIDHPLTTASNNQHAVIEHILDVFDIGDRFKVAYDRDPTVEGARTKKPDPHYIERAAGELGVDLVLYVGDSNVDVVTVDRTGIDSVSIRRPHRDGHQLAVEPTYELDLLDELLAVC